MLLRELFYREPLFENTLTKGSQHVLRDKKLVAELADEIKNDHTIPNSELMKLRRMKDEDIAKWFLEKLDEMERRGVGGVVSTRDGVNSYWIAKNYAAARDNYEDIAGIGPEKIRDFMILKNRNMLDANHNDIMKFKGIRDLGRYMLTHYESVLQDIRRDAELSAIVKNARSVKIVDNDDYRIYLLQNRGAACAFGKGASYCTANSRTDSMWKSYSAAAPIFGLVPKDSKTLQGRTIGGQEIQYKEKYQFDAGSKSFRNPTDAQENPKGIREKFPYLWDDLVHGLKDNREEIEEKHDDPEMKTYDVNQAIAQLKERLADYWTDKKRPAAEPEALPAPETEN